MGLLDDAIREHLELKRLRGADPGVVAREEHDALGPVRRAADASASGEEQDEAAPVDSNDDSEVDVGKPAFDPPESHGDPSAAGAGQETVEINMEAELGGEPEAAQALASSAGGGAPLDDAADTQPSSGDSLEWEMPGDPKAEAEVDETADDEQAVGKEPVEDVLEETPDFLRETPEQDRLWFEQRPPRDFDFNE